MTRHRSATDRLKVNPPLGRLPVLQYAPPALLAIDDSYQRSLDNGSSKTLIRRMAMHWNWDLCQPLVVARRAGVAELFVIDGQHRLAAAKLRGDISQLPCVIVEYSDPKDEAASFVHLNQQRRPLTKIDLFKAALASGDSESCAIAAALEESGLSIAPHTNFISWKPGMVANIAGIEQAWRRKGPMIARAAMEIMAEAFANQVLRYAGTIWPGIVAVCDIEMRSKSASDSAGQDFDPAIRDLFIEMLRAADQLQWRKDIAMVRVKNPNLRHAAAAAVAIGDAWAECLEEAFGDDE